jgi:hypothetical protein
MSVATASRLTGKNKAGLVLAGVLGAGDVLGPSAVPLAAAVLLPGDLLDAVIALLALNVLLGIGTIAGVVLTWTKRSRIAARVVAAARVIAALIVVPVFLIGAEAWLVVSGAAVVILNITAIVLVLSRLPFAHDRS